MFASRFPRRQFLKSALATGALAGGSAWAHADSPGTGWVLLGTQTGKGIYRARWNSATGTLGSPELAISTGRPTFLALHPSLPVVYACNENDGSAAAISAFSVNHAEATLEPIGTQEAHGNSPCFVSVDRSGVLAFTANYGGGSLSLFPLDSTGKPGPTPGIFACAGSGVCGAPGPVHDRQDGPHIHCAVVSPENRFVLACDLGDDAILVFPIHPGAAQPLGTPQRIAARPGSGPRHLAFHPNGKWLYCIHELDCTVELFHWQVSGTGMTMEPVPGTVVTLAPNAGKGAARPNTAAEIAITRDGHFLYTCTRGVDILTGFRIDPSTGKLTPLQSLPCGGRSPRFFALDPTESWLVCTNQDNDAITLFTRDRTTGMLAPHGTVPMPSPMCVVWL